MATLLKEAIFIFSSNFNVIFIFKRLFMFSNKCESICKFYFTWFRAPRIMNFDEKWGN